MDQIVSSPSIIPPCGEPLVSPMDAVVKKAAAQLNTLIMHRIAGSEMDKGDAQALVSDLLALARIVDPIVKAIGDYAAQYARSNIDQSLFTDQLLGALEGNATFVICEAVENAQEASMDAMYHAKHSARHQWVGGVGP